MCQVHTGAYVALLAPEKTDFTACHTENTTTYILHVVPVTQYTHVRLKSIGERKRKGRKEEKKSEKGKEEKRLE